VSISTTRATPSASGGHVCCASAGADIPRSTQNAASNTPAMRMSPPTRRSPHANVADTSVASHVLHRRKPSSPERSHRDTADRTLNPVGEFVPPQAMLITARRYVPGLYLEAGAPHDVQEQPGPNLPR